MNTELQELQWLNAAREVCAKHYIIVANPKTYRFESITVSSENDLENALQNCKARGQVVVKVCDVPQPSAPKPKVGDQIYIRGAMYIDHGEDDYDGGKATISAVSIGISAGKPTWFIRVKEVPGPSWNYDILMEEQKELKALHGANRAKPDPDYG